MLEKKFLNPQTMFITETGKQELVDKKVDMNHPPTIRADYQQDLDAISEEKSASLKRPRNTEETTSEPSSSSFTISSTAKNWNAKIEIVEPNSKAIKVTNDQTPSSSTTASSAPQPASSSSSAFRSPCRE